MVLRRGQYGCKFLGNAGLQGRGENHIELKTKFRVSLDGQHLPGQGVNVGNFLTWMISLPFSKGFLYWGIPSPLTIFKSPDLITSPMNWENKRPILF